MPHKLREIARPSRVHKTDSVSAKVKIRVSDLVMVRIRVRVTTSTAAVSTFSALNATVFTA